ncbi:MAG: hypothetical protein ACYTFT_07625, partial [Planctomycetota bacterium]
MAHSVCTSCQAHGGADLFRCKACGELVDVELKAIPRDVRALLDTFEQRRGGRGPLDRSGVWR